MKIVPPSNCPVCDSVLTLVKDQLFCTNKSCSAQIAKKLEHFCKAVKMKGFGPVALEKLDFASIVDIFTYSESGYKSALGDTIGSKLFNEVRNCEKTVTLDRVIAGLSIPLIGETASAKLCSKIESISDISELSCKAAGLGDKATNNLLEYIKSDDYKLLSKLLSKFKSTKGSTKEVKSLGKKVCITGKLRNFKNRPDAAKYLESLGFTVVDSVSKTTDILINEEDRQSSKLSKANSLGIRVTTIEDLEKEIN